MFFSNTLLFIHTRKK